MTDRLFLWALRGAAAVAAAVLGCIALFLGIESAPVLWTVGPERFFTDPSWHPAADRFDLSPMLWGSLLVTAGAVLLAAPFGIVSGLFSAFYAPAPLARAFRRLIELLAGIPSVVYGFWGLAILVPTIAAFRPPGQSLLAATLVLAVMILPTVALTAEATFRSTPGDLLRGAAALGLGRWATIRSVVLPTARSGLFTGVLLATGRAIGETMAVLMVCGNVVQTPDSLFDSFRPLTANIALEMAYAVDEHRSALFVSGLLLLGIIVALVGAVEWLGRGTAHRTGVA